MFLSVRCHEATTGAVGHVEGELKRLPQAEPDPRWDRERDDRDAPPYRPRRSAVSAFRPLSAHSRSVPDQGSRARGSADAGKGGLPSTAE